MTRFAPGPISVPRTTLRLTLMSAVALLATLLLIAPWSNEADAASEPTGLDIQLEFVGGEPPQGAQRMVGGGNLHSIMRQAARAWEQAYSKGEPWTLVVKYEWRDLGSGWGKALSMEHGNQWPIRIASGHVALNNNPPTPGFYADPTPRNNNEYQTLTLYEHDEVPLNRSRIFSDATGLAVGRIDLLTVATHEIGHLLGLFDEYIGYDKRCGGQNPFLCIIEITEPRPFAGIDVQIGFGPHIDQGPFGFDDAGPLMILDPTEGERQLISGIDALVLAELSSIPKINLKAVSGPP